MPAIEFVVEWPDGSRERCYSPSRAISEHLTQGAEYALPQFLERARSGLRAAAQRVSEVHGFVCGRALDQLRVLERRCEAYVDEEAVVRVLSVGPWAEP